MSQRQVLVPLLLAIALSGCGSPTPTAVPTVSAEESNIPTSPSPSATPAPSPSPSAAADSANATQFVVAGWYEPNDVFFVSPSKNLRCGIFDNVDEVRWGCSALEHSWAFPSENPGDPCYDAQIPCGFGIEGWGHKIPGAMMHSDVSYASEFIEGYAVRTLAYGETLTFAGVTCSSAEDGVTCVNTASGHGFTISKSRKEIF